MIVICQFGLLFEHLLSSSKPFEDGLNITAFLHRNNSQMVFLVHPDQKCFGYVVENTSGIRPVSTKSCCFKEPISLLEKEMIFHELFLLFIGHSFERIISSFELSSECVEDLLRDCFDFLSMIRRNKGPEWIFVEVSCNPNSSA